jgi:hypothetical protein
VSPGSIAKFSLTVALFAVACKQSKPRLPAIGEAYVGPANLKIRSDIPLQSAPVGTVKHGDRLEILQRRRRFLRVRTTDGVEGWTDERQLLSSDDMAHLRELSQEAAKLPAQGQGISYSELNVHTEPSRTSPSFLQVKEKEKMDVLTHVIVPRLDTPRKPLIPPTPKKAKTDLKKKEAKQPKYPPPPMPKPPPPPDNWMEMSKDPEVDEEPTPEEAPEQKPVATDDWSLIRTASGQAGWVLTRRLQMAIPDEVAQYAEGRRIVSYFSLGKVQDGDTKKDIWLWTTIGAPGPYDFDSFRVFIWSLRRHRYETAYIERNLQGFAPVSLKDIDFALLKDKPQKFPGFSVCVEGKDGQRYRREYVLLTNIVRRAGDAACGPAPTIQVNPSIPVQTASGPVPQPAAPKEGLVQRLGKRLKSMLHF